MLSFNDEDFPEVFPILSRRSIGDCDANRSELSATLCTGRLDCVGNGERRLGIFDSFVLVGVNVSTGFGLFAGFNFGIFPKLTGGGFVGGGSVEVLVVTEVLEVSDDFFSTGFDAVVDGGRTDGFSLLLVLVNGLATDGLSGVFVVTVVVVGFLAVFTVSFGVGTGLKTRMIDQERMKENILFYWFLLDRFRIFNTSNWLFIVLFRLWRWRNRFYSEFYFG